MDKSHLLGSGSFGKVYKVDGKDIAIKYVENDNNGMRELGEVNLLTKFNHPNILKRFDELFILPNEIGICLPFASTDLYNAVRFGLTGDRKQWIYELISGVNFIHKNGYYHCDIKAKNVFLAELLFQISD